MFQTQEYLDRMEGLQRLARALPMPARAVWRIGVYRPSGVQEESDRRCWG